MAIADPNRTPNPPESLLRLPEVIKRTGYSRSKIYALMSKEKFPKNRHIGNSRTAIWLESEIEEYIKNVIDMVDYNVNPHKAAKQTQSTAANQKAATNEEAQEKPRAAANAAGSTRTITGEPFERLTIEILRNKTTGETWLKLGNLNTDRLLQSIATMISLE